MKRFGILITLVASLLLVGATIQAGPAPEAAKPSVVTTKAADVPTSKTAVAAKSVQAPTLEQVEQQMQALYIEAGARVERIRVAQGELEQIQKNLEQLAQYKTQLTGKAPAAPAPVKAEGK